MVEKNEKKEFVPSWRTVAVCLPITLILLWIVYRAMDEALMNWLPIHVSSLFIALLIYCIFLVLLIGATMWFFRLIAKRYMEIETKRKENKG